MIWEDPIVKEVREIREKLLEESGGFKEYIKKLRKKEQTHKKRLVSKRQLKNFGKVHND